MPIEITEDGKIRFDSLLIAEGKELYNGIKRFIEKETVDESNIAKAFQITQIEKEAFEAQSRLQLRC